MNKSAKLSLAVIFGGVSSEHEVSRMSVTSILENLSNERYEVHMVGITKEGRWLLYTGPVEDILSGAWEQGPVTPAFLSPDPSVHGLVALRDGTGQQIGHAVAMALKNLMGLVCDPVAGLVEVPCVKRNVIGAVNAISAADMALAGIESRIPVDEVIDAMGQVGRRMPVEFRETALGGLAATPTGRRVKQQMQPGAPEF